MSAALNDITQTLLMIAKTLANSPDQVSVVTKVDGRKVRFTIHAAEADIRKLTGKQGLTAHAIRTFTLACAQRVGYRANVGIASNVPMSDGE